MARARRGPDHGELRRLHRPGLRRAREARLDKGEHQGHRCVYSPDAISRLRFSPLPPLPGITNQRETTVAWSRKTGKPVSRAIVWDDIRVKNLVTHFENQAKNHGVEYEGKVHKGEDGLKALRKLCLSSIHIFF